MITTKGLYHIGIPVNDVERAVKFYTEILGMTIAKLNRDDMGDHLNRADLRSGDSMVVLFQRPTPIEKDALKDDGATHHAFVVSNEDFELAVRKIDAQRTVMVVPDRRIRLLAEVIDSHAANSRTRRANSSPCSRWGK